MNKNIFQQIIFNLLFVVILTNSARVYAQVNVTDNTIFSALNASQHQNTKISSENSELLINVSDIAPIIDGDIDPLWEQFQAQYLNTLLNGDSPADDDLSAWFKVVWDAEKIYFLVHVTDNSKINDSQDRWQDDAIEIYLDINNKKQIEYTNTDYQFTFRWNDNQYSAKTPASGIEFAQSDTPDAYVFEISFTWAGLKQNAVQTNQLMGIDVHVQDDDNGGERDRKISWHTQVDDAWQNPSYFGTARLVGSPLVLFPAQKPKISVAHGFYSQAFDVTISSPVGGMSIYYTLDGSNPADSETAIVANSPVTVTIDPESHNNRGATPAVVLRAAAYKQGYSFSPAVTASYIFVDKLHQQIQKPAHDWPQWDVNGQTINLTISEQIYNDSRYSNYMSEALLDIPTISIVCDNESLFGSNAGIYVNASNDGYEWERPASVELINPDGSKGFQIDAGLRIRGGYSRNNWFAKHAFRLFFRKEYGEGKLDYPLFGNEGVDEFDKVDLRCSQNYSWHRADNESQYATFNRDVFSRDIQKLMNQPYTRSRYYHLYLNGAYWGLYQTQERSEARYAESYFGDDKSNYDVIKRGDSGVEATDGTVDVWREVWNLTQQGFKSDENYYKLMGLDAQGNRNIALKVLVDVDNLIDYMNIIFYTGNFDAPVSAFSNNNSINNFYAIYNRSKNDGFRFFAHDNEHSLLIDAIGPGIGLHENRVNIGDISGDMRMEINSFSLFNPQWLHHKLSENENYRMRFADRSYKYYHQNGILTPEKTAAVFESRISEIDKAIIAESVRWGNLNSWTRYTKDDHWEPIVERTLNNYFPQRTDIVIDQLKDAGLLPEIDPPYFSVANQRVDSTNVTFESGGVLRVENGNQYGSIYFTIDGSDPRDAAGAISSSAVNGDMSYALNLVQSSIINARVFDGTEWSAVATLRVNVNDYVYGIQISEIHYNPLQGEGFAGSQYEFIEIKNVSDRPINLTNASFTDGIEYSFNIETIVNPGEFIVLASQPYVFAMRYNFEPYGKYTGQLNNGGENITLSSATGQTLASVKYGDNTPWPTSADGLGFSIVPVNSDLTNNWDDATNWRASSVLHGTPGADDQGSDILPLIISEVLASTDNPEVDVVELYNPNNSDVDVSYWFLSDNRSNPYKWQIPAGTVISANSYFTFYEAYYSGDTKMYNDDHFGQSFAYSAKGDEAYVFSATQSGELTGYEHGFNFNASHNNISFGRHITSTNDEHFVAMEQFTPDTQNSQPKVGPLIINQLMYNPPEGYFEYIEIINISDDDIDLYNPEAETPWRVDGVDFYFDINASIAAGEAVYLVESALHPSDFKSMYGLTENTQVYNYPGKLDNAGERIEIREILPVVYEQNDTIYPYVIVDKVKYNDKAPWPDADGNGNKLQRIDHFAYGNDPASWEAVPSGIIISYKEMVSAVVGVPYEHRFIASGGMKPFTWSITQGNLPSGLSLDPSTGIIRGTPAQSVDDLQFTLAVSDKYDASNMSNIQISVHQNTLPAAIDDYVLTYQNIRAIVDVSNNDIDADNEKDFWQIQIVNQPENGNCIVNADNTISYTPGDDYVGSDEFTYQISDFSGTTQANVYILVEENTPVLTLTKRVNSSSDDAEENITSNQFWDTSTDLELTYDSNPGGDQIVGIRFTGIDIPRGAEIVHAHIQFTTDEISTSSTQLNISAHAADNSPTFSTSNLMSTRELISQNIEWVPEPWNIEGESSTAQQSPDLSSLIQLVVNRSGWEPGNALSVIINGQGTRVAESVDGDAQAAPLLVVQYRSSSEHEAQKPLAIVDTPSNFINHTEITFDGSASYSPDGLMLNYNWQLVSVPQGSASQLSNAFLPQTHFTPDTEGIYVLQFYVDNGFVRSDEQTLEIEIENHAPIAIAGNDITIAEGSQLQLDGNNSYDPENVSLSFEWLIAQMPQGSNASISATDVATPVFTPDLPGMYTIQLVVSDGMQQSDPGVMIVHVEENAEPIANIDALSTVYLGQVVMLDGDKSYDPNGDNINYLWALESKPGGSNAALSAITNKSSAFIADITGQYTVSLVVDDGLKTGEKVQHVITVINDLPPVADAGSNQVVDAGNMIQLDGSQSFDPDGNELTYLWSFVSRPEKSNAALSSYADSKPTFTPDYSGLYALRLRVSDGISTATADVQIVVNPTTSIDMYSSDYSLRVYPNPFSDRLYIETNNISGNVRFEIYSLNGILVDRIDAFVNEQQTQRIDFDEQNLRNGVYLLVVKQAKTPPEIMRLIYRDKR